MIKIAIVAILAALMAAPLKKEKSEFVILIGIIAGTIIGIYALQQFCVINEFVKSIWDTLPVNEEFLFQLLKMIGITYIADFAAGICKESGYQSMAGQVELFAKFAILALSLPGLAYLIEVMGAFV